MNLELSGAHGRRATIDDWKAGKDFKIENIELRFSYCSIRDADKLKAEGYASVIFYHNGQAIATLDL